MPVQLHSDAVYAQIYAAAYVRQVFDSMMFGIRGVPSDEQVRDFAEEAEAVADHWWSVMESGVKEEE